MLKRRKMARLGVVVDAQDESWSDTGEDRGHFAEILELEVVVVPRCLVAGRIQIE